MNEFLATALLVILALVALVFWLGVAVYVAAIVVAPRRARTAAAGIAVLVVWTGRPKWLCERMEGTR